MSVGLGTISGSTKGSSTPSCANRTNYETSFVKMLLLLIILLYSLLVLCFPLLLPCLVSAAQSSNISISECSARNCGILRDVGYPFGWEGSHCGASPYFLLSNCSGEHTPLWPGFNATYIDSPSTPAPAVIGINVTPDGKYNHVNLSWAQSINAYTSNSENPKCVPLPLYNSSSYGFPSSIKFLYAIASADFFHDFQFSANNIVLLFNCSNTSAISASDILVNDTDYCQKYNNFCNNTINYSNHHSCHAYNGHRELDLDNFIATYSCTHFQFFIVEKPFLDVEDWNQYALQLTWSYNDFLSSDSCQQCQDHTGSCGFSDDSNGYVFKCFCSANSGNYCPHTSINIGIYIGIPVAAIAAILVLIFSRIQYNRHRQRNQLVFRLRPDAMCDRPVQVPYKLLSAFKEKVGEGGNGVVYRGIMKMQQQIDQTGICRTVDVVVAVKVLDPDSRHSATQFLSEVSTIGTIHHLNVVKLLGFCTEKSHRILIYEFVSNGSLDRWIFRNSDGVNVPVLDWKQRYAIALGVARGLCYLHEECRHRIVHCDIKPHNILLDENVNPKISDFGLAKLITRRGDAGSVVTMAKGTPGYVAPEFWMGGDSRLTTKFDVYSYGMLLLEIISGRPNFDGEGSELCFPAQAFEAARNENFQILLDNRLNVTDLSMDDVQKLRTATVVALWCVQDSPDSRPSMKEVMQFLEGSLGVPEKCPPAPAILTSRANVKGPFWNSNTCSLMEDASLISSGR